ncbi:hypothetical protein EDD16DRAFT_1224927 [Pisolithus croceorrhizus]|nr:hypothetical protein EDD16DRAFT_1224927 [Pisolithus croceorrhizus]
MNRNLSTHSKLSSNPCLNLKSFPSRSPAPQNAEQACHLKCLTCCSHVFCRFIAHARILDRSGYDFFPQLHELEELLRDLPNLRVLRCHRLVWAAGIIPSNILSSLTTLAVNNLVWRVGHPEFPQEFITHCGKYFTVVKWYFPFAWYNSSLYLLLKFCLNLDRLTFSVGSLVPYNECHLWRLSFPRVSYLGMKLTVLTYRQLLPFLAQLRCTVPTLHVFQLLDPPIVWQLLMRSFELSTRVEDDEGHLLSDRCSEEVTPSQCVTVRSDAWPAPRPTWIRKLGR